MKHLTIYATLIFQSLLLILAAGVPAADNSLPNNPTPIIQEVPVRLMPTSMTFLKLDPMLEEMEIVFRVMREKEDKLLKQLQTATSDKQSERIILRIERLDVDRELALLKIQARYARLADRFELEKRIKEKISKILVSELALLN